MVAIELIVCFDNGSVGGVEFDPLGAGDLVETCDAEVPDPAVAWNLSISAAKESVARRASGAEEEDKSRVERSHCGRCSDYVGRA